MIAGGVAAYVALSGAQSRIVEQEINVGLCW